MAEQSGFYDLKQINELNELVKLIGTEELLIDNGESAYRVKLNTILGFMRSTINAGGSSGSSSTGASTIHLLQEGDEDVPIESRPVGHYYIRVTNSTEAQLASGLPTLVKVSPNMRLRMIVD